MTDNISGCKKHNFHSEKKERKKKKNHRRGGSRRVKKIFSNVHCHYMMTYSITYTDRVHFIPSVRRGEGIERRKGQGTNIREIKIKMRMDTYKDKM